MEKLDTKHKRAKNRVDALKGFYTHLTVYVLVNLFLTLIKTQFFTSLSSGSINFISIFSTPVLWGIGLGIHALFVFSPIRKMMARWERKKIQEYLDRDDLV